MMKIKTVGIYKIENLHNGRVYIGVSVNVERRFYQHKNLLENGKHPNKQMQSDFCSSGFPKAESAFSFKQLEKDVSVKDADEVEVDYIKEYASVCKVYNRKMASSYGYADKEQFKQNEEKIKLLGRKWTISECRINSGLTVEQISNKLKMSIQSYETTEETGLFKIPIHFVYFCSIVDVCSENIEHVFNII